MEDVFCAIPGMQVQPSPVVYAEGIGTCVHAQKSLAVGVSSMAGVIFNFGDAATIA